jgi:hypothetical protein
MVARLDRQPVRQLDGRRQAARVEVVDRCQVLHRERTERLRRPLERRNDQLIDVVVGPVVGD